MLRMKQEMDASDARARELGLTEEEVAFYLDQMIRLYSGRLGCGTCHSVYSKHAKHLVMDNRGSRLCIACHNR